MREDGVRRIEVHVGCICLDRDRVLVLKRSDSRKLYPGLWECGGGQVKPGEGFPDAVKRQLREEAGILVDSIKPVGTYVIDLPDGEKIPGVYFACRFAGYEEGVQPRLSHEHTEWKWIPAKDLTDLDLIPGVRESILKSPELLKGPE
jgi:8-oxo-dGTP diphosphatase